MSSIGLIWTAAVRGLAARITGARNRVAARRAALGARPGEIAHQPEPRAVGATTRARELEAGLFRFAGTEVEAPKRLIWDVRAPSAAFTEEIHRCGWLDDLAAAGDASARRLAQAWVLSWIGRFGRGRAPAWAPGIAGWRTMRWVVHAPLLLKDQDSRAHAEILRSLDRHARYLARRWHAAPAGLPRFAALAGLLHAALALSGARRFGPAARAGLARECARAVDETGGIPTRNPEELLELFTLLVWMSKALTEAGEPAEPALEEAIDRIAPTLRSLRLGDGSLARFHGGGPGPEGQLDQVLAESGRRGTRTEEAAMGFLRLHAGRTTMILDAAPPPTGAASVRAHASTLAFEMSSGRHPVVVNCGAGERFGGDWPRAARATAAHSTAQIARLSSSEIAEDGFATRRLGAWLLSVPRAVSAERTDDLNGSWILSDHDGFAARYGLRHLRRLFVAPDGRDIRGEDTIEAASKAERSRFDRELGQARQLGEPFTLHFHLHPDVEPELDPGGTSARLTLPGGEVWSFRQASGELALASSAYLDPEAAAPRTTRQIVVTGRILQYRGQVTWALVRGDAAERPRAPSVVPTRTRRPRALG